MDAVQLARAQFAANMTFHILFPTISIALGWMLLFGHGRVGERVHFLATFLVAFGTTLSAFWILALNSWMQTPTGHEIINGEFEVASWLQVLFNPSFPYRFIHMMLASGLTVAF